MRAPSFDIKAAAAVLAAWAILGACASEPLRAEDALPPGSATQVQTSQAQASQPASPATPGPSAPGPSAPGQAVPGPASQATAGEQIHRSGPAPRLHAAAPAFGGQAVQACRLGKAAGVDDGKVLAWYGLPYAKPPLGELRWKAPRGAEAWKGVLDATRWKSEALQRSGHGAAGSEDCLYLNVQRPSGTAAGLPVLVFVHGGGNLNGQAWGFDGRRLARRADCVVVTLSYRLGVLGWFRHPALRDGDPLDDSGNYGLLDIVKALEWVREEIGSFGGDPGNVTVMGQSAGARDVLALLVSPPARGLFQKAAALSGGFTLAEAAEGEAYALNLAAALPVAKAPEAGTAPTPAPAAAPDEAARLRGTDARVLVGLQPGGVDLRMAGFPHLFKDGAVLPADGFGAMERGDWAKVPLLVGSMGNEFAPFALWDPALGVDPRGLDKSMDEGKRQRLEDALRWGGRLYAAFDSDRVADAAWAGAAEAGARVWVYRLEWGLSGDAVEQPLGRYLGAPHGLDLAFLSGDFYSGFDKSYPGRYFTEANRPGREALSQLMASYLKRFLRTGDPNGGALPRWEPWTGEAGAERLLVLDADKAAAKAVLSRDRLAKGEILEELYAQLPQERSAFLAEKVFPGRFFWEY